LNDMVPLEFLVEHDRARDAPVGPAALGNIPVRLPY
jgi:hypothetical protein